MSYLLPIFQTEKQKFGQLISHFKVTQLIFGRLRSAIKGQDLIHFTTFTEHLGARHHKGKRKGAESQALTWDVRYSNPNIHSTNVS